MSAHKCPQCGAPEIEAETPCTTYACGSHDCDQRPGTFVVGPQCVPKTIPFAKWQENLLKEPENLIAPTESNVRYWTQRVMDVAYEDRHYDDNVERVIRELLEKDTEMAANDQARAVLDDIFELVDGYADGTADATSYDRLCAVIADKCRPFINPLNPPNP